MKYRHIEWSSCGDLSSGITDTRVDFRASPPLVVNQSRSSPVLTYLTSEVVQSSGSVFQGKYLATQFPCNTFIRSILQLLNIIIIISVILITKVCHQLCAGRNRNVDQLCCLGEYKEFKCFVNKSAIEVDINNNTN